MYSDSEHAHMGCARSHIWAVKYPVNGINYAATHLFPQVLLCTTFRTARCFLYWLQAGFSPVSSSDRLLKTRVFLLIAYLLEL